MRSQNVVRHFSQYWNNLLAISIFMFISNQESPLICEIPFSTFSRTFLASREGKVNFVWNWMCTSASSLYIWARSGLGGLTSFEGASHTMHGQSLMRRAEPIFNGNIMRKSFVKMLLLSQKALLPVRSWKRTLSALSEMGNSSRLHISSIISIRKKLYAKLKLARLEAPTMCMRRATNE